MAANIVQAVNSATIATNEDQRITIYFKSEIITRLRNLTGMSGKQPTPPPNAVEVGAIDERI